MTSAQSSSYIDARGSNFSHVGRDQNNFHIDVLTVNHVPQHVLSTSPKRRHDGHDVPKDEVYHKRRKLSRNAPPFSPEDALQWPTGSPGDVADGFIINIVQLLIDRGETRDNYRRLELELEPLRQTLILTNLAIQAYKRTPLGRNLEHIVVPEVEQICVVLRDLFNRIDGYRQGLWPTSIRNLWRKVCWRGCEVDDGLASLRVKLAARQQLLGGFLGALKSISWTELGNEVRAGGVSLKYFQACLRQGPLSLRHVQVDKITVVDHLGRNIPVPILFCSAWRVFDYIISGYCKHRPGNRFVEHGDYQVLRARDSQMIHRSEIASTVKPEMVLEMSIVMRQSAALHENRGKCPQCRHMNLCAKETSGWVECSQCSGQFQVVEADLNDEDHSGEETDTVGNENGDGEIMSPSPQTGDTRKVSDVSNQRPEDEDCTRYFRRVQVICLNNDPRQPILHPNLQNHEGGFSSAFELMSTDDPNVISGLATDGAPFLSSAAINVAPQDPNITPMPHKQQDRDSVSASLPIPGSSREADTREVREFWKQYMSAPLTRPPDSALNTAAQPGLFPNQQISGSVPPSHVTTSKQSCDQCIQSSFPCLGYNPCAKCVMRKCRCTYVKFHRQTAPAGPGHNVRDFYRPKAELFRWNREDNHLASTLSGSNMRATGSFLVPQAHWALTKLEEALARAGSGDAEAPTNGTSAIRTMLPDNADNLRSFEAAVLARKTPTLNLILRRRQGRISESITGPPNPSSQSITSLAATLNNNYAARWPSTPSPTPSPASAYAVNRPLLPRSRVGLTSEPGTSFVSPSSRESLVSEEALSDRPSFKRLPSQRLSPSNAKRGQL